MTDRKLFGALAVSCGITGLFLGFLHQSMEFVLEDRMAWLETSVPLWRFFADSWNVLLPPKLFPPEINDPVLLSYRPAEFFILNLLKLVNGVDPAVFRAFKVFIGVLLAASAAGLAFAASGGSRGAGIVAGISAGVAPAMFASGFLISDFEPLNQLVIIIELWLFSMAVGIRDPFALKDEAPRQGPPTLLWRTVYAVVLMLLFIFSLKMKETHILAVAVLGAWGFTHGALKRTIPVLVAMLVLGLLPGIIFGGGGAAFNPGYMLDGLSMLSYHHLAILVLAVVWIFRGDAAVRPVRTFYGLWLLISILVYAGAPLFQGRYMAIAEVPLAVAGACAVGLFAGMKRALVIAVVVLDFFVSAFTSMQFAANYGWLETVKKNAAMYIAQKPGRQVLFFPVFEEDPYWIYSPDGSDTVGRIDKLIRPMADRIELREPPAEPVTGYYYVTKNFARGGGYPRIEYIAEGKVGSLIQPVYSGLFMPLSWNITYLPADDIGRPAEIGADGFSGAKRDIPGLFSGPWYIHFMSLPRPGIDSGRPVAMYIYSLTDLGGYQLALLGKF